MVNGSYLAGSDDRQSRAWLMVHGSWLIIKALRWPFYRRNAYWPYKTYLTYWAEKIY
jgi:hypothetical protein